MSLKKEIYCHSLGCKMGFAIKGILRLLRQRFNEEKLSLTVEQYFLLNILENKEGLILQELADIVDKDKSAVTRHINSLEENHFIARAKDPEDKRRKILLMTKPGLNVLEQARKIDEEINNELTSQISDSELQKLEKIVSDIYQFTISKS